MSGTLKQLVELLKPEKIDQQTFRGLSQDLGTGRVFGGQVLGQAVSAAQSTVCDRHIHSAHAYFLRAGDHDLPITFHVGIERDGKSYSSRTVTASQKDTTIFKMMFSFQKTEASELNYAQEINSELNCDKNFIETDLKLNASTGQIATKKQLPFIIRFPDEFDKANEYKTESLEHFCLKTNEPLLNDPEIHRSILAYTSDIRILASSLRPLHYRFQLEKFMLATISHSIWFHRDFKIDDWLCTLCEPLSIANGRGISKGGIYNSQGILVATIIQEGVIRKIK